MLITLEDYWTGPGGRRRDQEYALALTHDIRENASRWVAVANTLVARLEPFGILLNRSESTGTPLNSGWRPPAVNAATPTASKTSLHMIGLAGDVDDDDGRIDHFLMTAPGIEIITEIGIWLEHPDATPGWSHWQIVPPRSGNRVFRP